MVAIGFSGLRSSVAWGAILCGVLAGCQSAEQASKADLKVAPAAAASLSTPTADAAGNVLASAAATSPQIASSLAVAQQPGIAGQPATAPLPGTTAQPVAGEQPSSPAAPLMAAVPIAAENATPAQTAFAAIDQQTGETLAAVAIPLPNPNRPGAEPTLLATPINAYTAIPLTPEMAAIQSVVPTPRPQAAGSAPVMEVAFAATPQINALAALSGTDGPPALDFSFDESGPTEVPDIADDSAPTAEKGYITQLISKYSKIYEVPESLLHRVVHRESRYNSKAFNRRGYFGLMQIKYNTAKAMGYDGPANGLFDAETNIKYAGKYLRGAWLVSDSKEEDAVRLYARGYYYDAKRKGMDDIANGDY